MSPGENLSATVGRGLVSYYDLLRDRVHELVDPLSKEDLWQKPFPYGNSVGHLLLHLIGNLHHNIGALIAGTGYVRDRPREFAEAAGRPKADLLHAFDEAVALVVRTLSAQSPADWALSHQPPAPKPVFPDRFTAFLRCAGHADHHVGQMHYLCKQIEARTAGGR